MAATHDAEAGEPADCTPDSAELREMADLIKTLEAERITELTGEIDLAPRFVDIGAQRFVNVDQVQLVAVDADSGRTTLWLTGRDGTETHLSLDEVVERLNGDIE